MSVSQVPDVDAPAPPPHPFHSIHPNSMIFLHRGQTRLQLANALSTSIHMPTSHSGRIWLLASVSQVAFTFILCAIMLYRKRVLGEIWAFTQRKSQTGTFLVPNAVFVLCITVALYVLAWAITALVVISFAFAHVPTLQWYWIIPLPWWPLVTGAYVSIHGFMVGCSPRSPLSTINSHTETAIRHKWYHLPLFKSAMLVNSILVAPCVLFLGSTIALVALSGRTYYRAKAFAHDNLPHDLLLQISAHARGQAAFMADADAPASDELIRIARLVATKYMTVHRYVSINLIIYASAAVCILLLCLVYGIPNAINLVDLACSRYPKPIPASCTTFRRKLWFLITRGKPTCDHSVTHLTIASWKMTILAVTYISILTFCVPGYAVVPVFIVAGTWPHRVQQGDISAVINAAEVVLSLIAVPSCIFVGIFCCATSLDPVFRAALGLNLIRTTIPVDITVEFSQHRSEEHEFGMSQTYSNADGGSHTQLMPDRTSKESKLKLSARHSASTIGSIAKSPVNPDFTDYPLGLMKTNTSDDSESVKQRAEDDAANHGCRHDA
ncbi:Protein phosphatase 2c [Pseudozyma hubeiensis]|nr:Protein phosphatase 2c [Pseudozyma hubeiensis]